MANKDKRGLASASEETRRRVASEGGKASHDGGRGRESSSDSRNSSDDRGRDDT